jgi:hypothetical protein
MPLRDYNEKELEQEDPVVFLEKKIRNHPTQFEKLNIHLTKKYFDQLRLPILEKKFI